MKTLIVFYSRSGNTKKVALKMRDMLKCDIEEIVDTMNRAGVWGVIGAGLDSILNRQTVLAKMKKDPTTYDLVIIGAPVWAGRISVPARTYISRNREGILKTAFFCTCADPENTKIDCQIDELFVKKPVAVLKLRDDDVRRGEFAEKLKGFVRRIKG
ncbi:MAG: hypothetical protein ABIG84_05520 [archaeon]